MALNTVGIFLNKTLFLASRRLSHRREQTSEETTMCIDNIRPGHQYPIKYPGQHCEMKYFNMPAISVGKKSHSNPWFSSVQSLSRVQLFVTPWTATRQASLSNTNSWSLPKLMSIESMMPSNHLILCHPLLLLPSIFPSVRIFSNELALHIRWPKYWNFSLNIIPSNGHPGLISLRIDWLDLLAVQGTQESSPTSQFKSINSSPLSFLYSPTFTSIHDYWKNHSLD